jgi:hypothetical protein
MSPTITIAADQWRPPANVYEYCRNIDASIITMYSAEIQDNRKKVDQSLAGYDRQLADQASDADRQSRVQYEQEWNLLGCASILYSTGSGSLKR